MIESFSCKVSVTVNRNMLEWTRNAREGMREERRGRRRDDSEDIVDNKSNHVPIFSWTTKLIRKGGN